MGIVRYLKGRNFCGKKFLRNLFLRMKAPKLANFAEFIFADRSFYLKFAEFNFADRSFYLKFAEFIFWMADIKVDILFQNLKIRQKSLIHIIYVKICTISSSFKTSKIFLVVSFELSKASISSNSSSDSFILSSCGDMKLEISPVVPMVG